MNNALHVPEDDPVDLLPRGNALSQRAGGLLLLAVIAAALLRSIFFVDETEYVVVTQFGEPVQWRVDSGLGFKWPFQSVWRFDHRLQVYAPTGREILTEDKENLNVEWYVCWRLPNRDFALAELRDALGGEEPDETQIDRRIYHHIEQFLQSVGTVENANRRLEERIQAALGAELGHVKLGEIVALDPSAVRLPAVLAKVTESLRVSAAAEYGIEVVDVRIRRFNYPESVRPAVFAEIRSERLRVADQYRAEGKSQAVRLRSLADLHREQILAQARREAAELRGAGEARAIEISNAAQQQDPEFYELLKTLDAYRAMLDDQTTIVLSADSPLLKLLTQGVPPISIESASKSNALKSNTPKSNVPPTASPRDGSKTTNTTSSAPRSNGPITSGPTPNNSIQATRGTNQPASTVTP